MAGGWRLQRAAVGTGGETGPWDQESGGQSDPGETTLHVHTSLAII